MAGRSLVDDLRGRVQRTVAQNAALLNISGKGMSTEARAKRFYDIPAKIEVAQRIAGQELARGAGHHNDLGDAMRHAQWSRRTAEAAGPIFAEAAGIAHEIGNFRDSVRAHGSSPYGRPARGIPTPGQSWDEIRMDLRNNAEGRAAAREGREVDPRRLQTAPRTAPATAVYRSPPASRARTSPR